MQIQVEILKVIQIPIMSRGSVVPAFLVVLKSQHEKRKIFGNCHKLKNYPFKISICDDLNKEGRELRKKVVEEFIKVKKLRKNSSNEHSIVGIDQVMNWREIDGGAMQKLPNTSRNNAQERIAKVMPEAVQLRPVCVLDKSINEIQKQNFFTRPESQKLLWEYKHRIIRRREQKDILGLLARIAAYKRARQKTTCTCKKKEEYDRYKEYIESKLMGREVVGFLFNVLKDANIECKNLWLKLNPNVDGCFCLQYCLEEKLLLFKL